MRPAACRLRRQALWQLFALAAALPAAAEPVDFRTAYALALAGSPDWLGAQAEARSGEAARRLGLAKLLPQLDYSYSKARNRTILHEDGGIFGPISKHQYYDSDDSAFSLSQPLFDAAAYAQWREGKARARPPAIPCNVRGRRWRCVCCRPIPMCSMPSRR